MNDLDSRESGPSQRAEAGRLSRVGLRANEWEWAGFGGAMPPGPLMNVMFLLGMFNSQAQTFFF